MTLTVGSWVDHLDLYGTTETADGGMGRTASLDVPGATEDPYGDPYADGIAGGHGTAPCSARLAARQRLSRGVRVRVHAAARGTAKVTGRLAAGPRRATLSAKVRFRRAGTRTVVLRPARRTRTALRRALAAHRGTVRITTRFTPAAGGAATTTTARARLAR